MHTVYPEGCNEGFAQTTIQSVASVINSMHKRGVMHRRIEADVIGMRLSTEMMTADAAYSYKLESIGGLNRVLSLPPNQKATTRPPD